MTIPAQVYGAALILSGLLIAALLWLLVRGKTIRFERAPSASAVLGVAGMAAYPVVLVGLAVSVGQSLGEVAGWIVAAVGVVAVAAPRLLRELDDRGAARVQVQAARNAAAVGVGRAPSGPPGPP